MIVVSVSLLYLELYVLLCYARILLVFYTYTKEGRPPSFFFFSACARAPVAVSGTQKIGTKHDTDE